MKPMLIGLNKDVIQNKEQIRLTLKGPNYEKILKQAQSNWVDFSPTKQEVKLAGIDSSFNSIKFQGAELWATTVASVESNGDIVYSDYKYDIGTSQELATLASKMELDACVKSVAKVDLVLMDGSLYSQFLTRQKALADSLIETITKKNNVVFISKTSNAKKQFENYDAVAGDIFYYNHATSTSGFSKIYEDGKFGKDKIISSVFARLAESLPLIKIELLGSGYTNDDFKLILNKIFKNSVGGYPYALKLAHNNCKITSKDMDDLSRILGLKNEIGSREVLG